MSPEEINNLRQVRKDKGLSIAQVAEEMKLSIDVIKKLENNQFDELGAFPYVRGYLSNYTKILGIDVEPYLELIPKSEISISSVNTSHNMTKGIKLRRRSKNLLSYALGTFIIATVSISGWFVLKNYTTSNKTVDIVDSNSLEITPQDSSIATDVVTVPKQSQDNYHYSSLIPTLDEKNNQTGLLDSVHLEPRESKIDNQGLLAIPEQQAVSDDKIENLTKYSITIMADQTSWVKVEYLNGDKLHNDLLQPGTIALESDKPLHFRIGNKDNVKVTINDVEIKLSDYSSKNIADFNWPNEG